MARRSKKASLDWASFTSPPDEFRPMPFWGLNDELRDDETERQIKEMKRGGWGGFFIHPRYGLETPYLSTEYMARVRTMVDEARKQELKVWIYDEHPFPAGCSGGLVGAESTEYRHRVLVCRPHTRLTPIEEGVASFAIGADGKSGLPSSVRHIEDPATDPAPESRFLHFYVWTMPVAPSSIAEHSDDFVHGFPYTDLLNPAAVARFLDLTYNTYKDALGDEFGKTIAGAFSDIPVYQWHYGTPRPSVPWTPRLPELFRERYGYDIEPRLAEVFFDLGDFHRVRLDYWRLVNDLFVEVYTKQVAAWCSRNGLKYSAHYWGEETLHWQVAWTGDVMEHFMHQDYVGNDHILRNIDDPLGIKQSSTVADQLGKERQITETYALTGHNLTFEERKWIGDWEYALGTNFLVPYIPAYSFRGRRKRDEPPSQFFQQPYWEDDWLLSDYFGRLSYVLTRGEPVVDVLLMQPFQTAQILFKPVNEVAPAWRPTEDPYEGAGADLFRYSDRFRETVDWLLAGHRDFHLGNEAVMAEHAEVDGDTLRVGKGSYRVVIVPPSVSWSRGTAELLATFARQGGKIIVVEPLPTMIDAERSKNVLPPGTKRVKPSSEALLGALDKVLDPDVVVPGAPRVIYQHRRDGKTDLYFFANTSLSDDYRDVPVSLSGSGSVAIWDAVGASRRALGSEEHDGRQTVRLDFAPGASHLLVRSSRATTGLDPFVAAPKRFDRRLAVDTPWKLTTLDDNALTLDYCVVRVGDDDPVGPIPTWKAHELLFRAGIGAAFTLDFSFDVGQRPSRIAIGLEDASAYTLELNGSKVPIGNSSSWWDSRIRLIDVTDRVRKGRNDLRLRSKMGLGTEVEPVFLVGDFGVERRSLRIGKRPKTVKGTNLVDEGFPFYAGRAVLSSSFTVPKGEWAAAHLAIDDLRSIVARVRVNGEPVGHLAWRPHVLDVTRTIRSGRNEVEIEIASSLHNLLGPHHNKNGEARHFVIHRVWMDEVNWTDDYFFVPFGVKGASVGLRR